MGHLSHEEDFFYPLSRSISHFHQGLLSRTLCAFCKREKNLNDRESHPKWRLRTGEGRRRRGQEQHPHLFAGVRLEPPSRKWWADRADTSKQRKATNRLREKTGWARVKAVGRQAKAGSTPSFERTSERMNQQLMQRGERARPARARLL